MNERQKMFCINYIGDLNAAKAARDAGYSTKTAKDIACENLAKPNIKRYTDILLKSMKSSKIADQTEVLEKLTQILRGELEIPTTKVKKKENGAIEVTTENVKAAHGDIIRTAELIGKRYGIFIDVLQLDGEVDMTINIRPASEDPEIKEKEE